MVVGERIHAVQILEIQPDREHSMCLQKPDNVRDRTDRLPPDAVEPLMQVEQRRQR